jgi:hypothetical protein
MAVAGSAKTSAEYETVQSVITRYEAELAWESERFFFANHCIATQQTS